MNFGYLEYRSARALHGGQDDKHERHEQQVP